MTGVPPAPARPDRPIGGWTSAAMGALLTASIVLACTFTREDKLEDAPVIGALRLLDRIDAWRIESSWNPLARSAPEAGIAPLTRLDFEHGLPQELVIVSAPVAFPGTPALKAGVRLEPEPAPAARAAAAATGTAGLRFEHAAGVAFFAHAVTPDTPYLFSAAVRRAVDPRAFARDAAASAGLVRNAGVASLVVLELNRMPASVSPAALLEALAGGQNAVVARHTLPPPERLEEFAPARLLFRSSVFTNALLVLLVGGNPGWWALEGSTHEGAAPPAGAVDFDDVALWELPLARYLPAQDESAQDDLASAPAPAGTPPRLAGFCRKVKLLADVRRALLAPPGTRATALFRAPQGRYRLSFSYGVLEERRSAWGATPIGFEATLVDGAGRRRPLLSTSLVAGASVASHVWQEFACELDGSGSPDAGSTPVGLELATTCRSACTDVAAFAEVKVEPLLSSEERPRNVLLLSVDTLRADRLGCYGYKRADGLATSPHLDAFAAESLRFAHARTVAPFTLPSHATIFTGLYPAVHQVTRQGRRLVPGVHPLLAEAFAQAGFATAGFTGGAFVSYEHGFHHGFDRYSILDPFLTESDPYRDAFPRPGDRAWNDAAYGHYDRGAIEHWIDGQEGRPFFLFVHTYVVHNYHPPEALAQRFVGRDPTPVLGRDRDLKKLDVAAALSGAPPSAEQIAVASDLYDAALAAADREVGALLDFLRARGLLERTVVAIVSDHGEELGEHGGFLHGRTLYEELLRIPFLLRVPGVAPAVIDETVDLADLAPTLRDAAGLPEAPVTDGMSVLRRRNDGDFRGTFLAEVSAPGLSRRRALFTGRLKVLENPATRFEEAAYARRRPPAVELFDCSTDPLERVNLVRAADDEPPAELAGLLRGLAARRAELAAERARIVPDLDTLTHSLSAEGKQMLLRLGYVDGGAADDDEEE